MAALLLCWHCQIMLAYRCLHVLFTYTHWQSLQLFLPFSLSISSSFFYLTTDPLSLPLSPILSYPFPPYPSYPIPLLSISFFLIFLRYHISVGAPMNRPIPTLPLRQEDVLGDLVALTDLKYPQSQIFFFIEGGFFWLSSPLSPHPFIFFLSLCQKNSSLFFSHSHASHTFPLLLSPCLHISISLSLTLSLTLTLTRNLNLSNNLCLYHFVYVESPLPHSNRCLSLPFPSPPFPFSLLLSISFIPSLILWVVSISIQAQQLLY